MTTSLDKKTKNKLINFSENDLDKVNPYKSNKDHKEYENLDIIVKKFIDIYDKARESSGKNVEDFSWLEKLNNINEDNEGEKISIGDSKQSANINYGMPTHINGDYKNGVIYHCMFNPGTNKFKDKIKKEDSNIYKYYTSGHPLDMVDLINNKKYTTKRELDINKRIENIRGNIIGEDSMFTKELSLRKNLTDKEKKEKEDQGYKIDYYMSRYYSEIVRENKYLENGFDPKKTNKLVNIELFPLRSEKKTGVNYKDNKFSFFGAYIILHRIGKDLANIDNSKRIKPIFVFRSFEEWKNIIITVVGKLCEVNSKKATEIFEILYNDYFYEMSSPARGSISSGNLIKDKKNKIDKSDFYNIIKNI